MHMTNDEDFSCDELEADMRKLDAGQWIDTESLLIEERNRADTAEARIAGMTKDRDHWREARRAAIQAGDLMKERLAEVEWCALMSRGDAALSDDDAVQYDRIYAEIEHRARAAKKEG